MSAKKKTTTKKKTTAAAKPAPRKDFGAPVDGFFAKQTGEIKAIADELRALVEKALPKAESSLKWGMPCYTLGGKMAVTIGVHKAHVNFILAGPPGTYPDPKGLLQGEGKTGKHLKLEPGDAIPTKEITAWLKLAAKT